MSTERNDQPSDRPAGGHQPERGPGPERPGRAAQRPEHPEQTAKTAQSAQTAAEPAAAAADLGADGSRERPARRSRLTVAVVAAAVLLAGGGGAYWAAASGDGGHDDSASQPLRLDGPGVPSAASGESGVTASGGAAYRLTGTLPQGPKTADVYRAAGGVDQAAVLRLARSLGLTGPVRSAQGSWQVSATSAAGGPALLVGKDAPGTWSYTRYGPPPATAHPGEAAPSGAGSSGSGAKDGGSTGDSSSSTATLAVPGTANAGTANAGTANGTAPGAARAGGSGPVPVRKAMAAASPVLAGLGLSGARIDAAQTTGALRTVTADPVVAGLPTHGWATTLQVGADGRLTMGYGRLSALVKGDGYPVVDAARALAELNATPVEHPMLCAAPEPESGAGASRSAGSGGSASSGDGGPRLRTGDPCVRGGRQPVEVRGAHFGLAMQFVSGGQALVPAWLFDTAQAGVARTSVVAQVAVDPADVAGGGSAGPGTNAPGGPSPVAPAAPVDPGGPERTAPSAPVDPKAPHAVPLTSYRASGSTLTLVFWSGVCGTYQAAADESGAQVRVHVTMTPETGGRMCPMIAKAQSRTVKLARPLGARTVVDASDGQPVRGQ